MMMSTFIELKYFDTHVCEGKAKITVDICIYE
jgi:hypothetical protein